MTFRFYCDFLAVANQYINPNDEQEETYTGN